MTNFKYIHAKCSFISSFSLIIIFFLNAFLFSNISFPLNKMSTGDNNTSNDVSLFDIDTQQLYLTQFWIFLLLIIPSIICSLFGLYHFLMDRTLRQALNNHIIILLLCIDLFYNFTDMSLLTRDKCWEIFSVLNSKIITENFQVFRSRSRWTLVSTAFPLYLNRSNQARPDTIHISFWPQPDVVHNKNAVEKIDVCWNVP
jgi:hypothetical protein